jgi:hypothetical protein
MPWLSSRGPAVAAWLLGALTALALAGSVYRVPIQVSDSLEVIQRVVPMSSAASAFVAGLHNSASMLRPLKDVRTKLLVQAGETLGGRYHLVFRGYHVLAGAILIGLFVWVCRARTWTDVAALACALVVLTGMHTFVGLFREAFPVNHFLIVAVCTLATFAIAQTRGGWLADLAAVGLFAAAALSFESGLLVWPVAVAAYASGLRGISRRGLIALTTALLVYAGARTFLLTAPTLGVGQRETGFGAGRLSPEEQVAQFGSNPLPFYAYNVTAAAASVLFSQPTVGQFTVVNAWEKGPLAPVHFLQIGSSLVTSLLIGWYGWGRDEHGRRRRWREPIPLAFFAILVSSALLSYVYTKDEIISAAGVFYALAAFWALRALAVRPLVWWVAPVVVVAAVSLSAAWAVRSVGLHLKLRHGAFEARSEWTFVLEPATRASWPKDAHTLRVVARMRDEALMQPAIAPAMLPSWTEQWWGED